MPTSTSTYSAVADLPEFRSVPLRCGFRDITILRGIIFEVKCPGARLTHKAPKCSTIIRREIGLKGKPESLALQLFDLMLDQGMIEITTKEN